MKTAGAVRIQTGSLPLLARSVASLKLAATATLGTPGTKSSKSNLHVMRQLFSDASSSALEQGATERALTRPRSAGLTEEKCCYRADCL